MRTFFLFFIGLTLFVVAVPVAAQLTRAQLDRIDSLIQTKIKPGAPGLALGIVQNNQVVYEKYAGYANLQHQVPIDEKTRFNLASVAKQFTALCLLKLVLENKISLEDDLRKYVPNMYAGIQTPILVKHLLTHSSGIRDYYDLMSIQNKPWWRQEGLDNNKALELLSKQEELNFLPDTERLYSNSNYTLLTKIIEVVTKEPFDKYAKSVFVEMGLTQTDFLTNYMQVIPYQALPYSDWGDGSWQQYPMMTNLHGDGFLFTTLRDQMVFEQAIQQAKATMLPLLTISQQPIPNTTIQSYGYGLEFDSLRGYRRVYHSGSTGSYHANTMRFPEEKISIVILSNNGNLWGEGIVEEIALMLLPQKKTGVSSAQPYLILKAGSIHPSNTLAGEYRSPENNIIRIKNETTGLYWQMDNNNPRLLVPERGNSYHFKGNEAVKLCFEINKDSSGSLTVYDSDGSVRVHPKLRPFYPTKGYLEAFVGRYYSKELETGFSISLSPSNTLLVIRDGNKREQKIEVVQQEELLFGDYKLKVSRDAEHRVMDLFLTYNRIKKIRFGKMKEVI